VSTEASIVVQDRIGGMHSAARVGQNTFAAKNRKAASLADTAAWTEFESQVGSSLEL
jgi:hypothetical protein